MATSTCNLGIRADHAECLLSGGDNPATGAWPVPLVVGHSEPKWLLYGTIWYIMVYYGTLWDLMVYYGIQYLKPISATIASCEVIRDQHMRLAEVELRGAAKAKSAIFQTPDMEVL